MNFRVLGRISHAETIARGAGIRELSRLRRTYGPGNWRKRKGTARIQLDNGDIRLAELLSGDLRVVDESGEDYPFPASSFVAISVPERVRSSLRRAAS